MAETHIHKYESVRHRRMRLKIKAVNAQCLCSNGSYHAAMSSCSSIVTCPACLEMMKDNPHASSV